MEADYFSFRSPTLVLMVKVWETAKNLMGYYGFTEYSALWNNKKLHEVQTLGEI